MRVETLILVVTREAELREAKLLAEAAIEGGFKPTILVSRTSLATVFDDHCEVMLCADGGIRKITADSANLAAPVSKPATSLLKAARSLPLAPLLRGLRCWKNLFVQRRALRRLLGTIVPRAIFLFDERTPEINMPILREAQAARIRTIVVPYAMAAGEAREYVRIREPLCHVCGTKLSLVRRICPSHLRTTANGVNLLFYPFWDTMAVCLHGFSHVSPWTLGGGLSTILAVFGEYDRLAAEQEGVDPGKIRVTGQPSLDELDEASRTCDQIRRDVAAAYGLSSSERFIVCAVPHQAEENLLDENTHAEQTRALFAALSRQKEAHDAHVLLSLHPKSDVRNYQSLADEAGLTIVSEPLTRILPLADIMVGTLTSTIRWAAGLAIPVVVIDTLRRGYTIFDHLECVRMVYSADELGAMLEEYFCDAVLRERLKAMAQVQAKQVALIDGKVTARLLGLVTAKGEV